MTDRDELARVRALGEALGDRGHHREALVRLAEAVAIDPDDAYSWSLIAWNNQELAEWPAMLEAAETWLRLRPHRADAHSSRSWALNRLGRRTEALAAAHDSVRCGPDEALAWRRLAIELDHAGEPGPSRDAARRACELEPEYAPGWITAGRLSRELGDYAEAEGQLRQALTVEPGNLDALHQLAFLYGHQNRFDEAIEISSQILSIDPGRKATLSNLVDDLVWAERTDEAFDLLRTCVLAYPGQASFREDLVGRLSAAGRDAEAIAVAREAVRDLPDDPLSWWCLGRALPSGDPTRVDAARRVIELRPHSYLGWFLLGDVLRETGDLAGAADAYESGAAAGPGDRWVQEQTSYHLRKLLARPEAALPFAERAVELAPLLVFPRVERVLVLRGLGRHEDALAGLREACQLESATCYTWLALAQMAALAGLDEEAELARARLDEFDDEHVRHEAAAIVAFGRGDKDDARARVERALDEDPTCCCSRAIAVLCGADDPTVLAGPADRYTEDGRCYDQLCPLRALINEQAS